MYNEKKPNQQLYVSLWLDVVDAVEDFSHAHGLTFFIKRSC